VENSLIVVRERLACWQGIAIPNYVKSRRDFPAKCLHQQPCGSSMAAVQQWALDNKKAVTDSVQLTDATPYLKELHHMPIRRQQASMTVTPSRISRRPQRASLPGGKAANGHFLPQ